MRAPFAWSVAAAMLLAGCAQPGLGDDQVSGEVNDAVGGEGGAGGEGSVPGGSAGSSGSGPAGGSGGAPPGGSGPTGGPGGMPPPGGSQSGPMGGSMTGTTTSSSGTGVKSSVPRSLHESTWLCQTPVAVDDLRPAGTDDQQCKVTLTFSDTQVTVQSSGIPNHDYDSGGGCCAKVQSLTNVFPLQPEMAKTPTYTSTRGAIAIAVNGVAIFGPEDSNDQDVVIWTYTSDQEPQLSTCDGHSEPNGGTYHYHADANCIHWHAGSGEDWYDYDFSKVDKTAHSKIVGFAKDGFPIYGSYGWAANSTTVKEITSSYRLKTGATGANGIADQEYVAGLGDLDECNGRFSKTPEFPDGIYHYYSTKHNGAGSWGFPYFPLCYKGVVASSGGTGTGGTGGTMPGGSTSGTQSGMPPGGSMSGSQSSGSTSCPPPPPPGQPPPQPPPPGCGPPPS